MRSDWQSVKLPGSKALGVAVSSSTGVNHSHCLVVRPESARVGGPAQPQLLGGKSFLYHSNSEKG